MPRVDGTELAKPHKAGRGPESLAHAAAGLEAEFTLFIDDRPARPEAVFGDPRGFLSVPLLHRTGRSFHLPSGAAVYFDTGVIEIATPPMELERGCFARLARSLEEALAIVRDGLDEWERRSGQRARLQGFSAHYNVSPPGPAPRAEHGEALAWLLAHILPAPVMLLATNRESTGVGVRPRPPRLEVTVDYSPDPLRVAATGAVIGGVVSAVSRWSDLHVSSLGARGIPVLSGFAPIAHTSRQGWLARYDCYPANPFASDPDATIWRSTQGAISIRALARLVVRRFQQPIRRLADPLSWRLARLILAGEAPSWLGEDARPTTYDDAGRIAEEHVRLLRRFGSSAYERVLLRAIAGTPLHMQGECWYPERVRGWSQVQFRRERDGLRRVESLDTLVALLDRWR